MSILLTAICRVIASVWNYKVLLMTCKCTSLSRIFETLTLHSELIFRLLLLTSSYPTTSSTLIKASEHMVNKFLKTCFSNLKFRTELVKHFNIYRNSDNTFRVWFNSVNVSQVFLFNVLANLHLWIFNNQRGCHLFSLFFQLPFSFVFNCQYILLMKLFRNLFFWMTFSTNFILNR